MNGTTIDPQREAPNFLERHAVAFVVWNAWYHFKPHGLAWRRLRGLESKH
jgi:hypothetical protein